MRKPSCIRLAVNLIWISVAATAVKVLIDRYLLPVPTMPIVPMASMAVNYALILILVIGISRGKRWARLIFTGFSILGTIPAFWMMLKELSYAPVLGLLSLVQLVVQTYAIYLLFTKPQSLWFKRDKMCLEEYERAMNPEATPQVQHKPEADAAAYWRIYD